MGRIEPADFLNHYFPGYKNKIFSSDTIASFYSACSKLNLNVTEENIKFQFADLLKTYFNYSIVADFNNIDLAIVQNNKVKVIFEFKKLSNIKEMPSETLISKALAETIWYFYKIPNEEITNIVITNGEKFYFIDPICFNNSRLNGICKNFIEHKLSFTDTNNLYEYLQDECKSIDFDYTEIDLSKNANKELIYKFLHPDFLTKEFSYKDSNSLSSKFYDELLYILGLQEEKTSGKLQIVDGRIKGSLLFRIQNDFNVDDNETALNILTVWLNRILFLKLFDSQLLAINKDHKCFFTSNVITNFQVLNNLFFNILGKQMDRRTSEDEKFKDVPYINSSLFERSKYEEQYGNISNINNYNIAIKNNSILKSITGYAKEQCLLKYLLDFLDCYNFTNVTNQKETISTSVLGLIFEKLNGYKDGSYFTPAIITEYMSKDCIDSVIIDKFNLEYKLDCKTVEDLRDYLSNHTYVKEKKNEFNRLFNGIKIIDIAVGSGHFLVSCLNYLVYLKFYLGLLNNPVLNGCVLELFNDNLVLLNPDGISEFRYRRNVKKDLDIQKHIFETKADLIKNCLYGIDINPKSVEICRLRLWIELLKNAYYKTTDLSNFEVETLPNIDINIICGNSILYKIPPKLSHTFEYQFGFKMSGNFDFSDYARLVRDYKNSSYKSKTTIKRQLQNEREKVFDYIESNTHFIEYMVDFPDVLNDKNEFTGFDLVIGNPPYIKEYDNRKAFDGLRNSPYYEGKMDLWSFFTCTGIDILKKGGYLSFIAPNNWTTNYGAKKMRNKILADSQIQKIIDFHDYMVFSEASIQTMIFKLKKVNDNSGTINTAENIEPYELRYNKLIDYNLQMIPNKFYEITVNEFCNKANFNKTLSFNQAKIAKLLEKIKIQGNYYLDKKSITNGIHTHHSKVTKKMLSTIPNSKVNDSIFVLSQDEYNSLPSNEKSLCKPYFECLIGPYFNNKQNEDWLIYTDSSFKKDITKIDRYPTIKKHLDMYQDVITSDNRPYGLHRARNESFFVSPKIVSLRMCSIRPCFTYIFEPCYVSAMFYVIRCNCDLLYLLGLLNSKLVTFWLKHKGKMQGKNYQVDAEPLMNIPLCVNKNLEIENMISSLTKSIVESKNLDSKVVSQIDSLVYKLYELTADEIKIVEDSITYL